MLHYLLPVLVFVKLVFLKLFLTTKTLFPLNFAGLPPSSILSSSSGSSPTGEAFILSARLQLTSAQILTLQSGAPLVIVPAPGVGFQIVPLFAVVRLTAGAAAYTDAGGGAVQFNVGSQVYALSGANAIFLVTVAPNRRVQVFDMPGATGTAGNPPTEDNAALTVNKATANFAAGNGTAAITVYYSIEPTL